MEGICKWCGYRKDLDTCHDCGLKGVVNTHKEIFEEDIIDKITPIIGEINFKIDKIDKILSELKIYGLKVKLKTKHG